MKGTSAVHTLDPSSCGSHVTGPMTPTVPSPLYGSVTVNVRSSPSGSVPVSVIAVVTDGTAIAMSAADGVVLFPLTDPYVDDAPSLTVKPNDQPLLSAATVTAAEQYLDPSSASGWHVTGPGALTVAPDGGPFNLNVTGSPFGSTARSLTAAPDVPATTLGTVGYGVGLTTSTVAIDDAPRPSLTWNRTYPDEAVGVTTTDAVHTFESPCGAHDGVPTAPSVTPDES